MGSLLSALTQLEFDYGSKTFKNIVDWTLENSDVSVTLAVVASYVGSKQKSVTGSVTATELCGLLTSFYELHLQDICEDDRPVIKPDTFSAFIYGKRPEPRWRALPAVFLLWLASRHEEGVFDEDEIVEQLLRSSSLIDQLRERIPSAGPPKARSNNYAFFTGGNDDCVYSRRELEVIASRIRTAVGDRADHPEYPMMNRRFPATPAYELVLNDRVIYLKDESARGTGTHKERMAHEVIVDYARKHIATALSQEGPRYRLPRCSIISSGSAAIALQIQLDRYRLPNLHVVMDERRAPKEARDLLERWGAVVFTAQLDKELIDEERVLELTENPDGIDLTPRAGSAQDEKRHYEWLASEILNLEPRHIFVPVGTGDLYSAILRMLLSETADDRLIFGISPGITLWGATTDNPRSQMSMLYARHRPGLIGLESLLEKAKADGVVGPRTGVHVVKDDFVRTALASFKDTLGGDRFKAMFSIRTNPSGIAGLALFNIKASEIPRDERVVVVNTGSVDL